MKIKIILTSSGLAFLYLTLLFFTNKVKFQATVKVLVHQVEWLFSSGLLKREWVDKQIDLYVGTKSPITKLILKFIVKYYADKFIEQEVKVVNETTKHVVKEVIQKVAEKQTEKVVDKLLDMDAKASVTGDNLLGLAKELKIEAKDKGFFVGEAGLSGNTEREGVDYFAKIGVGRKF